MDDVTCFLCGNTIEGSAKQKTGRPKQLHKECRELNNAFSLLNSRLDAFIEMNPSKEKKNKIRSSLWSIANGLNGR